MSSLKSLDRQKIATAIAIIFHLVGFAGIAWWDRAEFVALTPMNLLLSFALLLWCSWADKAWIWAAVIASAGGFTSEVIGVNAGWLFGDYSYGSPLGTKWLNVPLLIGVNWFMVLAGVLQIARFMVPHSFFSQFITKILVALIGALLAIGFDYLVEPVAIKLDYWRWLGSGEIPLYNYICWICISFILLMIIQMLPFRKNLWFPGALFITQTVFFLLLGLVLNLH